MRTLVLSLAFGFCVFSGFSSGAEAQVLTSPATPGSSPNLSAELTTYLGRNLSPEEPATSLTFEPTLSYRVGDKKNISLASLIDRPTNPYEELTVPTTALVYSHEVSLLEGLTTTVRPGLNAINLHRWSTDGRILRATLGFQAIKEFSSEFSILARVTPGIQANEYTQKTSGADLPRGSLSERLSMGYQLGKLALDITLIVSQVYTGVWKNDYDFSQSIDYAALENLKLGISHGRLGSLIDDSTGFYSAFSVYDDRKSRVSAFATMSF